MEDLAADYVAAVREIQPQGPYQLGGWSAGGLIALEMAQQLRDQGQQIELLALLDTTPPEDPDNVPGQHGSDREYGLDLSLQELAQLGPDEQIPYLWQHSLKLGLVEPGVPLELAEQGPPSSSGSSTTTWCWPTSIPCDHTRAG
jgi:pimeloyl-ACP methyl ester carboxylesterase